MNPEKPKVGSLRDVMPQTAELVDWLRSQLGTEAADRIVLKGKKGLGGFYAAEIGPDGVFREFGSPSLGGGRAVAVGDAVAWQHERTKGNHGAD